MPLQPRFARSDDIPEIVRLRRMLFASLGESGDDWEAACAEVLRQGLTQRWVVGAVVDQPHGAGLVAVGTAEIQQRLPGPTKPTGRLGYVGTMATDPAWRRRGLAHSVLSFLLDHLGSLGVDRIELHATPVAETLYRRTGFSERPGGLEMRFVGP
jgi:GNAT superfamily N-acetyltransferase